MRSISLLGLMLVLAAMAAIAQDAPKEIVPVGAGSYTTKLPDNAKEPAVLPYVTADVKKPVPTNDWWSSLLWLPFSNQMFAHPLVLQAHDKGLRMYCASWNASPRGVSTVQTRDGDIMIGHSAQATFPDARAAGWNDWFVTASFVQDNNTLLTTFGHGSPFVYGTIEGGDPTFTLGSATSPAPPVFAGDANSQVLGVTIGKRSYALFGPKGCTWDGIGTKVITCKMRGAKYFSVAGLPDGTKDTLALFTKYAYNHVTDTRVSWAYDEKTAKVTTKYAFAVKQHEGTEKGTIYGLYPHQYMRSSDTFTDYTYTCARGVMKVGVGEGFTTVTPFQGVLPMLPNLGTHDPATLKKYIAEDVAKFKPGIGDTYWCGKAMGKLSTLASIANVIGDTESEKAFRERLKGLLENFLTAEGNAEGKLTESRGLYYYNKAWGTLIGYPASYMSDTALNDHHFHYGYHIRAAAEIARLEPEWGKDEKWGGMINMLIRDCSSPDRDDPMFPFLRNYDIYEGHTWADGKANFADGNNNESSSEAMDAWTGLILWGAATGDKKTRDAGIFLYVTEKDAIDHYWFNAYGLYPKEVTVVMDSMIWGSSAQHATWFSGDPICIFGIEYLPMQSGSFYLGTNPDYVKKSVQSLNDERIAWDKTQWEKAKDPKPAAPPVRIGKNMGAWGDLIFMYQALADPAAVLAECDFDKQPMEGGNSRANLYQWVHFLNTVGQVDVSVSADTPLYSVFKQGDTRTYMVYNPKAEKLTVKFSDGKTITTDKAGIAVATGQAK